MIGGDRRTSALRVCLHASDCYGIDERSVVALVLVGTGLGESRDCASKNIGGTEIARDRDRVAGVRVPRARASTRTTAETN